MPRGVPARALKRPALPVERTGNATSVMYRALIEAESALAIKASLRDSEQARCQRALDTVRAAIAEARGEVVELVEDGTGRPERTPGGANAIATSGAEDPTLGRPGPDLG